MRKIIFTIIVILAIVLAENFYNRNIKNVEPDFVKNNTETKMNLYDYDVTLNNIEGEEIDLSDYKGKTVILNFWASWCDPCIRELPEFNELNQEIDKDKIDIFMINLTDGVREKKEDIKKYVQNNKYTFNVLFDEQLKIADKFNVMYYPTTFVFNKDGDLVEKKVGGTTKEELNRFIEEADK
jgi:thiol-disulfide isomerase/thioredoxin